MPATHVRMHRANPTSEPSRNNVHVGMHVFLAKLAKDILQKQLS